uniref:Uncharacterized protein n=1 Tax=Siphoviridae sp. ctVDC13 TaxID=2827880 RepID=A0A8S5TDM8_9CAUD|nr:MAG TPA: hypothetical protein [Siphoviridae sp. ctVDC13]
MINAPLNSSCLLDGQKVDCVQSFSITRRR